MRFLFVGCFKGQRTQPQVGVRRLLANACVMQRVYLSSHFVSFRNISQNCPMPSSPVNVTFCPSTSSAQINLRELSSYASFLTTRVAQATVGCLMLAYSFSQRVHSIPRGHLYNARTASEERSKRLHLRKSNAADIASNRTRRVKCKALARKRGC